MITENQPKKLILSENATAKHAGVARRTLIKYRTKGSFLPVKRIRTPLGLFRYYFADDVKAFFDNDPEFQANKARLAKCGKKRRKAAEQ
jgi:hypothetical protein